MGKQRKTWSTDTKEAIVLSVLRGELGWQKRPVSMGTTRAAWHQDDNEVRPHSSLEDRSPSEYAPL